MKADILLFLLLFSHSLCTYRLLEEKESTTESGNKETPSPMIMNPIAAHQASSLSYPLSGMILGPYNPIYMSLNDPFMTSMFNPYMLSPYNAFGVGNMMGNTNSPPTNDIVWKMRMGLLPNSKIKSAEQEYQESHKNKTNLVKDENENQNDLKKTEVDKLQNQQIEKNTKVLVSNPLDNDGKEIDDRNINGTRKI